MVLKSEEKSIYSRPTEATHGGGSRPGQHLYKGITQRKKSEKRRSEHFDAGGALRGCQGLGARRPYPFREERRTLRGGYQSTKNEAHWLKFPVLEQTPSK